MSIPTDVLAHARAAGARGVTWGDYTCNDEELAAYCEANVETFDTIATAADARKLAKTMGLKTLSIRKDGDGAIGVCSTAYRDDMGDSAREVEALCVALTAAGLVILTATTLGFTACPPSQATAIRARRYAAQAPRWHG